MWLDALLKEINKRGALNRFRKEIPLLDSRHRDMKYVVRVSEVRRGRQCKK